MTSAAERRPRPTTVVRQLLLHIIEMKFDLAVDASRAAQPRKPSLPTTSFTVGEASQSSSAQPPEALARSPAPIRSPRKGVLSPRFLSAHHFPCSKVKALAKSSRLPSNASLCQPDFFEEQKWLRARIVQMMPHYAYSDRTPATLASFNGSGRAIEDQTCALQGATSPHDLDTQRSEDDAAEAAVGRSAAGNGSAQGISRARCCRWGSDLAVQQMTPPRPAAARWG